MPRKAKTENVFEFPEITQLNKKGKAISPVTKSYYKSYLNKLVVRGFKNIQSIQENPDDVVKAVKELFPDDAKRKVALFAIFYVLRGTEFSKSPNPLYWYLQTLKSDTDTSKVEDNSYMYE